MVDLLMFCHPETKSIGSPFSVGEYTFATNGSIIVRVPRMAEFPEVNGAPEPNKLPFWDHDEQTVWDDLPAYDTAERKPCESCQGAGKQHACAECDGEGEVEFSTAFSNYECECKSCLGDGFLPSGNNACSCCFGSGINLDIPVKYSNRSISMKFLEMMQTLPVVKICPHGEYYEAFRFTFDGGCGAVMPMLGDL
ncbi:MAG: hypothetical protein KAT62_00605 [Desulfuromonadales bacterium]|nr:hypothetical protein [Desulfuromonadales bacterium]